MSTLILAFNKAAAEEFRLRVVGNRGLRNPTVEQQAVIEADSGTILVDARPGSGKTATLVTRTLRIEPEADVRTFHSWALRELGRSPAAFGFRKRPQVNTSSLFRLLNEATGSDYRSWDESGWDEDWVALAERGLYTSELEEERDKARAEGDKVTQRTAGALLEYRRWLLATSQVTFDAMVRLVAEGRRFLDFPSDHVMVDEYQDVDRFQYDLVERMGELKPDSLCVVGDPNQRIYEWRGALADSFDRLATRFTESLRLPLSCNFRSLDDIIEYADKIAPAGMHGIRGRHEGAVVETADPALFWRRVTEEGDGTPPLRERAVLCRYNRTCAAWQLRLAKAGVPVYLVGKGDFWNSRHVKIVVEMREKGEPWAAVEADWRWQRMKKSRIYQGEDGAARWYEMEADASWLHSLTDSDFKLLRECLQDEGGIRVSTIHRSKGTEYAWVGVPEVDRRLREETYVWYVAASRAKDRLTVGTVRGRREEGAS